MPAARLSSVPWYIRDWWLSKTRHRLEPDQRSAYIEILWLMYESDDGFIDHDEPYFCRFTGLDCTRIAPVLQMLNPAHAERFSHPKVQEVLKAIKRTAAQKRKAAQARWAKRNKKQRIDRADADSLSCNASLKPEALPEGFQPSGYKQRRRRSSAPAGTPVPARHRGAGPGTPPATSPGTKPTPRRAADLPPQPAPCPPEIREQLQADLAKLAGRKMPQPRKGEA